MAGHGRGIGRCPGSRLAWWVEGGDGNAIRMVSYTQGHIDCKDEEITIEYNSQLCSSSVTLLKAFAATRIDCGAKLMP